MEATDNHPAQVDRWQEDERVGKTITTIWSGMMTQAAKDGIMDRLGALRRAVKQARMRANTAEVTQVSVADDLLKFILQGS